VTDGATSSFRKFSVRLSVPQGTTLALPVVRVTAYESASRPGECNRPYKEVHVKRGSLLSLIAIVFASMYTLGASTPQDQKPQVEVPKPGVPQAMTIQGEYIRIAYNNEGYVSLGYRIANMSVGDEWMLLDMGTTVRDGIRNYTLTRDKISLDTPNNQHIPLPDNKEYRQADLRAMENRAKVVHDSINYFPPSASRACRIGFFADVESRAMPYDQVELSSNRACVGRLYFKIPGGIQYGQHWLNVQFAETLVRVPFRILTKEEQRTISKNYGDIKKQVDAAFKKKKG
jgi:hypothetical protein